MAKQPPGYIHLAEQSATSGLCKTKHVDPHPYPAVFMILLPLIKNNHFGMYLGQGFAQRYARSNTLQTQGGDYDHFIHNDADIDPACATALSATDRFTLDGT